MYISFLGTLNQFIHGALREKKILEIQHKWICYRNPHHNSTSVFNMRDATRARRVAHVKIWIPENYSSFLGPLNTIHSRSPKRKILIPEMYISFSANLKPSSFTEPWGKKRILEIQHKWICYRNPHHKSTCVFNMRDATRARRVAHVKKQMCCYYVGFYSILIYAEIQESIFFLLGLREWTGLRVPRNERYNSGIHFVSLRAPWMRYV